VDYLERAREAAATAEKLLDGTDAAGRSLTESERSQCKRLLEETNGLHIKAKIADPGRCASSLTGGVQRNGARGSLQSLGGLPQRWMRRPMPAVLADCDRLAEAGGLERRRVDATGDPAFRWTEQAETALDMNNLTESVKNGRTDVEQGERSTANAAG
jgi:hypothetical protein